MDKNAIKKFAVWARRELIARVSQKAEQYGITEKDHGDVRAEQINGRLLSRTEQSQRKNLIDRIAQAGQEGYRQVMEEVAYTWFNRFIALRFMEVNGYLPSRVRVFTDEQNAFKPQILAEAIHMEQYGFDMEKVYAYKEKSDDEALFKYLLITQCNALNDILPGMFQKIADYTELLFPDNLLRDGSVIEQMIALIPEEDWLDQVQIIGWLYQYYNTEPKDRVFANLKKNIKIGKRDIPAATQLFTPDWIVRYMVENSLGRLWVEGHPDDTLKANWKYYLEEAPQEPQVQAQLAEIRKGYAQLKPEDIRCIDPCMGSGHILCYLFDVLVQIYEAYGYSTREAVRSILENNLYGLDIDDRAAQLAYFAVMMKARQYDRRFFTRGIQPHVMAIQESNALEEFDRLQGQLSLDNMCLETANQLIRTFRDAKEYGSILNVDIPGLESADRLMEQIRAINGDFELMAWVERAEALLPVLAQQAVMLQQKYDVVITNPPYMGNSSMTARLLEYVKKDYPDSKSDMFSIFMERCMYMTKQAGFQSMITQHAWMSLASYEKLRLKLTNASIVNMAHLGARAFDEVSGQKVQTTSFVIQNMKIRDRKGIYCRLVDLVTEQGKEAAFLAGENRYTAKQESFSRIPGAPVSAYVASDVLASLYEKGKTVDEIGDVRIGMGTGNNDLFLRLWWEVKSNIIDYSLTDVSQICATSKKYYPYSKGGERKRWYGNHEYAVWYDEDGQNEMKQTSGHRENGGYDFYFHKGMTWTYSTMSAFCARIMPSGFVFDVNGSSLFLPDNYYNYVLSFLQSCVGRFIIESTKSAFSIQAGTIRNLPITGKTTPEIDKLSDECISISRSDWDSFETSWDFTRHPLIKQKENSWAHRGSESGSYLVRDAYMHWENECNNRFNQVKANEEKLNRIFIDIYGLQNELVPEVNDIDMTIHKAYLQRDIKSLISYAVGCMLGRYSLDVPGLAFAGGEWDAGKYATFPADRDGILPICDDDYFTDDIVSRFVQFVEVVYGRETLEENLKFIADALGGRGTPREVIRGYFLNDFYADHCKTYQKRPIYWLFDSGKKNGFKCLIYMHRYAPDTIARIRTDYVHEQQSRYRTAIADLEKRVAAASTAERVKLQKQLNKLRDQAEETRVYEEKIHHYADQMIAIDLDDGVKLNYGKFQDVLGKIK